MTFLKSGYNPTIHKLRYQSPPRLLSFAVWRGLNRCSQGFCNLAGDVVLNPDLVLEWSIIGLGPDNVTAISSNETRSDLPVTQTSSRRGILAGAILRKRCFINDFFCRFASVSGPSQKKPVPRGYAEVPLAKRRIMATNSGNSKGFDR
jgi:hypothetical protein